MKTYSKNKFNTIPDAVLFDLDNTLYSYEEAHLIAQEAVKEKTLRMLSISPKDFDDAYSQAKKNIKAKLKNTAASHSRLLYLQNMLEILKLGTQILLALDLEQTYWRKFLGHAILFDDVKEFLEELNLLNIPAAIITDLTVQIQFRKIIYFGLDKYFKHVITSEESGFDKPHESSFKLAIDKLQPKGNCIWMIGDDPIKDIGGARNNINAITIQKIHKGVTLGCGENVPDACFTDFNELRKFILKIQILENKL